MFLFTVFAPAAWAGEGFVTAKGVGVAPITGGKQGAAKRVSLQLAKRDAVERALGAVVLAESIPGEELTRVTASSSARLSYKVLSEGAEGEVYITEIEAVVEVPPELLAKYPRPVEEEATGYAAAVQKFPHGELNWRDGYLTARGTARMKGSDEKSKAMARRAARVDAYGVALRMVSGVNFDPAEKAGDRIKKTPVIEYRLKGLIRGAEVIEESCQETKTCRVTIKVPLRGIMGLQRAFTESMNLKGPGGDSPGKVKEDAYTGVVVDARGLGLEPAMFPEIVDEDGNVIYNVEMVDPGSLAERGLAAYVTGDEEPVEGAKGARLGPGRYLAVTALAVLPRAPGVGVSGGGLDLASLFSPLEGVEHLAEARRRVVIRQGSRPVNARASAGAGATKSRVVISSAAGARVRQARAGNDFLRQGRVVIITDSMIGGTEGRLWIPHKSFSAAR